MLHGWRQVDVTAEDSKAGPGEIPAVDQAAVKAAEPMAGVLGQAQRQMGGGWGTQDPWHAIRAGVAPVKPHKAQVTAGRSASLIQRTGLSESRQAVMAAAGLQRAHMHNHVVHTAHGGMAAMLGAMRVERSCGVQLSRACSK